MGTQNAVCLSLISQPALSGHWEKDGLLQSWPGCWLPEAQSLARGGFGGKQGITVPREAHRPGAPGNYGAGYRVRI